MTKTTNNQQRKFLKTKPNKAKVKIGKMSISIDTITEVYPTEAGQPVRRSKSEDGNLSAVGGTKNTSLESEVWSL